MVKNQGKKFSTSKFSSSGVVKRVIFDKIFHASLKSLVASLVAQCPRDILMQVTLHLNQSYANLKDPLLDYFVAKYPVKAREYIWESLTTIYKDILHPLLQATNTSETQPVLLKPSTSDSQEMPQPTQDSLPLTGDKVLNYDIRALQQKNL